MLKYKFLGLFTITIILISFLSCTVAINPDDKSDPKTTALLNHIISLGGCSEYEATLILRCIVEQRGDDWGYDFLGRYTEALAGDQKAQEELQESIWFATFVEDFNDDIKEWSHKSLEDKARALNIKDIKDPEEFQEFMKNCTAEEQLYIYDQMNTSLQQAKIIGQQASQMDGINAEEAKAYEEKFNNVMAVVYATASNAKVEYQILLNSDPFDWFSPLDLINSIMSSNNSTNIKVNRLNSLKNSYNAKYAALPQKIEELHNEKKRFGGCGVAMITIGAIATFAGSVFIATGIASLILLNPAACMWLTSGTIVLGLGIALDWLAITAFILSSDLNMLADTLSSLKDDLEGHKVLVASAVDEAIKTLQ